MKRCVIAFYYEPAGHVEDYYFFLLDSLRPFSDRIVVVSNGALNEASKKRLAASVDAVIERENEGFDAWAYKTAIEQIGWKSLSEFDELVLLNHTFFGPIFPFSEMFAEMESRTCDFWGISAHKAMRPHPFDSTQAELPFHLNSHFIAVRSPLLESTEFAEYWDKIPPIKSYMDSVGKHEAVFSRRFQDLGYVCSVYVDPADYKTPYPVFMEVDRTIEQRSPILKKRLFFHDTLFLERGAINLPRALELIKKHSDYDLDLIWRSVGRLSKPRTLNNNAALMSVLPEQGLPTCSKQPALRIGVFAHIFYPEMTEELIRYVDNIPPGYDLFITTDSIEKKALILPMAAAACGAKNVDVLVVDSNKGRDVSALLIGCRDLLLDNKYDLVCRLHSKQSPQDGAKGDQFKHHMFDNLLYTPGYVLNLISLFAECPSLGLVLPAMIHVGYPTMGQSWFGNRSRVEKLARELGLNVQLDDNTPVAPYGGMYWFRPMALRKLFAKEWSWRDFADVDYGDGSLPHAIERLIAYVALDAGYVFRHILTPQHAARNYTMLEAKLQAAASGALPADFAGMGVSRSFQNLIVSLKRSIIFRSPLAFRILRPPYRLMVSLLGRLQ
ncbi:hypothetical protein C7I87_06695 [Mesorhizobium sp. SARCC-RB16n]|nr:hypothetical protein C7I87_06695 [Mesorhizobium sp. SARCC-RB16n]